MEYKILELLESEKLGINNKTADLNKFAKKVMEEAKEVAIELEDFNSNPNVVCLERIIGEVLDLETICKSIGVRLKEIVGKETYEKVFYEAYGAYVEKLSDREWRVGGSYEIKYRN